MNIAFVFPGQASQFVGMGKDLYRNFAVAKNVIDEVDDAIDLKVSQLMFEGSDDELTQTENAQVAIMATSIATLRVIEEMSGRKYRDMCIISAGHSLGQYSAMCAGGCISLSQCAKILRQRGLFMKEAGLKQSGGMAAILKASDSVLTEVISHAKKYGVIQIANDNSDTQKVISGHEGAIEFAIAKFKDLGIRAIRLRVSSAFHSELMEEAAIKMHEFLDGVSMNDSEVSIIDNTSLNESKNAKFLKEALVRQIPSTVLWRDTMSIIQSKSQNVIEVGPGKVLSHLFRSNYPECTAESTGTIKDIEDFCRSRL